MLKKIFAFILGVIAGFLFLLFVDERSDRLLQVNCDVPSVVAQYGDTLWDIGRKHCGGEKANMLVVRDQLVKINGANLRSGQLVILPHNQP